MPEQNKKPLRVAILANDNFEEAEMTEPGKFLQAPGAKTVLNRANPGKIRTMRQDEKSGDTRWIKHSIRPIGMTLTPC